MKNKLKYNMQYVDLTQKDILIAQLKA